MTLPLTKRSPFTSIIHQISFICTEIQIQTSQIRWYLLVLIPTDVLYLQSSHLYWCWCHMAGVSEYYDKQTWICPPFFPQMLGTWLHRFQVPTLQIWELGWSTGMWDAFLNHTHGFTNTHSTWTAQNHSTNLLVVHISSFWQHTPICNFIGKAGLYHWLDIWHSWWSLKPHS